MKKLVVFYSLEGNTKLMAESIAGAAGADMLQLLPLRDISPRGVMKYLRGGKAVMRKEAPELHLFSLDPDRYDFMFIGTPVWAGSYAPALNTFFTEHRPSGIRIALFCCHGGGKGRIFEKMREALDGNEFVGEMDFRDPLKHDTEAEVRKAEDWARDVSSE